MFFHQKNELDLELRMVKFQELNLRTKRSDLEAQMGSLRSERAQLEEALDSQRQQNIRVEENPCIEFNNLCEFASTQIQINR